MLLNYHIGRFVLGFLYPGYSPDTKPA